MGSSGALSGIGPVPPHSSRRSAMAYARFDPSLLPPFYRAPLPGLEHPMAFGHFDSSSLLLSFRGPPDAVKRLDSSSSLPSDLLHHQETWEDGLLRLRKPKISPEDAGLYTCALESRGARAEGSFDVQVLDAPKFVRHLEPEPSFVEGDPVLLQCQVRLERAGHGKGESFDCKSVPKV